MLLGRWKWGISIMTCTKIFFWLFCWRRCLSASLSIPFNVWLILLEESYDKVLRNIPEERNFDVSLLCLARYQRLHWSLWLYNSHLFLGSNLHHVSVLLSRSTCPYIWGELVTDGGFDTKCSQILLKWVGWECSLRRSGPTAEMQFADQISHSCTWVTELWREAVWSHSLSGTALSLLITLIITY